MPNWKSYESSVRLLSAILAAHPELRLNYGEIAKCFGGDCTPSALENRFRRIKTDAKCIKDAIAKGIDPITLAIEGGRVEKEVAKYYGDCTASSLEHRFRPIKKEAQQMRNTGGAIADKYGEGTTAKAVSMRFERLRKESSWLTNDPSGGSSGTPSKAKANSARKARNATATRDQGNSDDEEPITTPTKKALKKELLNRTQNGRVTKVRTPRKVPESKPIYVGSDGEEDDIIKTETNGGDDDDDDYGGNMEMDGDDGDGTFYDAGDAEDAEDFSV